MGSGFYLRWVVSLGQNHMIMGEERRQWHDGEIVTLHDAGAYFTKCWFIDYKLLIDEIQLNSCVYFSQ